MTRTISGLVRQISPGLLAQLLERFEISRADSESMSKSELNSVLLNASETVQKKLDDLRARIQLLTTPIGDDYVSGAIKRITSPTAQFDLRNETERALWLWLYDEPQADKIARQVAFDSRFERSDFWAGIRLQPTNAANWPALYDKQVLRALVIDVWKQPIKTRLHIEIEKRPGLRDGKNVTQITLSKQGRLQAVTEVDINENLVTKQIEPSHQVLIVVDENQNTLDVVSDRLGTRVRNAFFKAIASPLGIAVKDMKSLAPRLPNLSVLRHRTRFECAPSQDGFERVNLVGVTISHTSRGLLVLNTKSLDEVSAYEAFGWWQLKGDKSLPDGTINSASMLFTFKKESTKAPLQRVLSLRDGKGLTWRGWRERDRQNAMRLLETWGLLK